MHNAHTIPAHIFRGNDIRGLVGKDLDAETYAAIGKGYGTLIRQSEQTTVYVGYDSRNSSQAFAEAFAEGLAATGCTVRLLGMVPTPVLYYAATRDNTSFGAMITASHLPATYNGVKLCRGSASLSQQQMTALRELVYSNEFVVADGAVLPTQQIADEYIEYVLSTIAHPTTIKVVLDCQNGAASLIAPKLIGKLATLTATIHCDPQAGYPFERPDPQHAANLVPLQASVRENNADLGIAYDGDADRVAIVDHNGDYVLADYVLALFARSMLSEAEHVGAKVVFDVLSSSTVYDEVIKGGGEALWCKSGHSYIKQMMVQEGAKLGGESSGHIFFADRYPGYDDGIYASCRLIELLQQQNDPLAVLVQTLQLYVTSPEERPYCPDDQKRQVIEALKNALGETDYTYTTLDGMEIYFPHGRGVVRFSNTEPALSVRFEASNANALAEYSEAIWHKLSAAAHACGVELLRQE
jgi:phosphomannomutase / phosphoglucomutase